MKFLLTLAFIISALIVGRSQDICSGNLGENIFDRGDFGSGPAAILTPDPGIAPGYNYTTTVPSDGWYTVCNNTGALSGLYATWLAIEDNSSDPNGYMMVVNASFSPGIFYEEEVSGLCENTLYEFSADIINLIRIGVGNHIDPNVSFLIDGVEVYTTGEIPKTEEWRQYGFSFVTTSDQSTITLTLRNNAPGGIGNDLALDNISFRPCGPSSFIGIDRDTTIFLCIDDDPLSIVADIQAADGQDFAIQWQSSANGIDWTTLEDSTNKVLIHTLFDAGDYYYRYYSAGNEINILNEKCRIISDEIKITILPDTYTVFDTICEGLVYDFGVQQLTESGSYIEDFQSQYGCDSTVFLELYFIPEQEIFYDDIEVVDPSCYGFDDGLIQINTISGGNGDLFAQLLSGEDVVAGNQLPSGTYRIHVVDRFQCTDELIIQLIDPPQIFVEIGEDTTVRLGDELSLSPRYSTSFDRIEWQGQGGFSCLDCEEPFFVPYFTGPLLVNVEDDMGCRTQDSIFIEVDVENFLVLPNVFSPNEDRINDEFTLYFYGRSVGRIVEFSVYDRWGGRVHQLADQEAMNGMALWDGYGASSNVEDGIYLYNLEVDLINGTRMERTGSITVLK